MTQSADEAKRKRLSCPGSSSLSLWSSSQVLPLSLTLTPLLRLVAKAEPMAPPDGNDTQYARQRIESRREDLLRSQSEELASIGAYEMAVKQAQGQDGFNKVRTAVALRVPESRPPEDLS